MCYALMAFGTFCIELQFPACNHTTQINIIHIVQPCQAVGVLLLSMTGGNDCITAQEYAPTVS